MESSVESIMTGEIPVESILRTNKEKIYTLTTELESIVRKGYFEIIKNTELLQTLVPQNSIPEIQLPPNLSFEPPGEIEEQESLEDKVWSLINSHNFTKAGQIIKETSIQDIKRIGKVLKSPYFYNIFDLKEGFIDRIESYLILQDNIEEKYFIVVEFVISQLLRKDQKFCDFEELFEKSRKIFELFVEPENEQAAGQVIQLRLKEYLELVRYFLTEQIENTSRIDELHNFISKYSNKYNVPTVWDLVSTDWKNKASFLILNLCKFSNLSTLQESFSIFEENTKPIIRLFESHKSLLHEFKQSLCPLIHEAIISSIPENASLIILLGIFSNYKELSVFQLFTECDFSDYLNEIQQKVAIEMKDQELLPICIKIRSICADKPAQLPNLKLAFGPSQSGIASFISQTPSESYTLTPGLPSELPGIELLNLPIALSTHLLLS